jgi:hypothetical protein
MADQRHVRGTDWAPLAFLDLVQALFDGGLDHSVGSAHGANREPAWEKVAALTEQQARTLALFGAGVMGISLCRESEKWAGLTAQDLLDKRKERIYRSLFDELDDGP